MCLVNNVFHEIPKCKMMERRIVQPSLRKKGKFQEVFSSSSTTLAKQYPTRPPPPTLDSTLPFEFERRKWWYKHSKNSLKSTASYWRHQAYLSHSTANYSTNSPPKPSTPASTSRSSPSTPAVRGVSYSPPTTPSNQSPNCSSSTTPGLFASPMPLNRFPIFLIIYIHVLLHFWLGFLIFWFMILFSFHSVNLL